MERDLRQPATAEATMNSDVSAASTRWVYSRIESMRMGGMSCP
jgi:hypothetical protein